MPNQFPVSDYDGWTEYYDRSVLDQQDYPFTSYKDVLAKIVFKTDARPGMRILDLGTGTGNLALPFARAGCNLWCTDFSEPMLARARQKILEARFILHDLRTPFTLLGALGLAMLLMLLARLIWRIGVRSYSGASA